MLNNRLFIILLVATILLLLPLVFMQFSDEVNWTSGDFLVAGAILYGGGILCELIFRMIKKEGFRIIASAVLVIAILLVWAELAVGIFGTPFAGS